MMLLMTLKMAVEAPIPSASVMIATAANPGVFVRFLNAYRMSCPSVSMMNPLPWERGVQAPLNSLPRLTYTPVIMFDSGKLKKFRAQIKRYKPVLDSRERPLQLDGF